MISDEELGAPRGVVGQADSFSARRRETSSGGVESTIRK